MFPSFYYSYHAANICLVPEETLPDQRPLLPRPYRPLDLQRQRSRGLHQHRAQAQAYQTGSPLGQQRRAPEPTQRQDLLQEAEVNGQR